MDCTIFEAATGRIIIDMTVPAIEDAQANLQPGQLILAGRYPAEDWYVDLGAGVQPMARPQVPAPVQDGHLLAWPDPPPGLLARVHDLWIDPPHLLAETLLTGPDCGLLLTAGNTVYRIALTAAWPWRPRVIEVAL